MFCRNKDFYFTREIDRDYNLIVVDCGVVGEKQLQEEFLKASIRVVCGSVMPYETPGFYKAIKQCQDLPIHALGLFAPGDIQSYLKRIVDKDIFFGESSHDLFDSHANTPLYKRLLEDYMMTL